MAPAWQTLMEDFKDSDTLFVTECDCTGDCKDLCNHVGVQGYPTIKHGDPNALEDYKGARDLDTLQTHAASIKMPCSPKRRDLAGHNPNAVIQKHGNICNQNGEYHKSAMLICPPNGPVSCMPIPIVAHQRNQYSVVEKAGVHWIKQHNVYYEDFT